MPQKEGTNQYGYFVKKNILEHLLTMMIPVSFVEESGNGKSAKLACSCAASSFVKSSSPLTAAAKKKGRYSTGLLAEALEPMRKATLLRRVTTCYDLLSIGR